MTKFQAIHTSGVTVEVLQLHGPSGGWPEVRFTGDAELIFKLALMIYEDENVAVDAVEPGDYPLEGEPQDSFEGPFATEVVGDLTEGVVLHEVVRWLDEATQTPVFS